MKRTCLMLAAVADRMALVKGLAPVQSERLLAAARGELPEPPAETESPPGGEETTKGEGGLKA